MTPTRAYKLAVDAVALQIKTLAVDANLHDHYGADYPQAVNASKKRAELLEAIEILKQEAKRGNGQNSLFDFILPPTAEV